MTMSDGVDVNVTVAVGIAVFVGIFVVVFVGVAVEPEERVVQLINPLIIMTIIINMNDFELAFNNILHTIYHSFDEAPNGLRYLRWGGDGEAVQLEK